jgi:hypothetical protein
MKRWLPALGAGLGHMLVRPGFAWGGAPPFGEELWQWFVWLRATIDFWGAGIAVALLVLLYQRRIRDPEDRRAVMLWVVAGSAVAMNSGVHGFGCSLLGLTLILGVALGDYRGLWGGIAAGLGLSLLCIGVPSALLVFSPFVLLALWTLVRDKKARLPAGIAIVVAMGLVWWLTPEQEGSVGHLTKALSGGQQAEGLTGLRALVGRDLVLAVGLWGWLYVSRLGLSSGLIRAGWLCWILGLTGSLFLGMGTDPTYALALGTPILGLGLAGQLNRDLHVQAPWLGFITGSVLFMLHVDGFATASLSFRSPYWATLNGPVWLEYILPAIFLGMALWLILRTVRRQSGMKARATHMAYALGTSAGTVFFMRWANH